MTPEHPYPQSINDCYTVTLNVIQNSKELGINLDKLVLAGDSAGGNVVDFASKNATNFVYNSC